ncbi:hypothetical protein RhiXN_07109 [Rhizoctonia solani]|uniref:Uncharacterized protein n=1 Tax=Rhizoctonia solani TaxID=456999 RepID=A0A8H8P4T4_9AGAM|nr:uncharacterized protein RhiXN_07109 [Rhizoctonia solani]QRW25160.1 hypothetical protein RhiXN_07109 [Rhizoctonia solani]
MPAPLWHWQYFQTQPHDLKLAGNKDNYNGALWNRKINRHWSMVSSPKFDHKLNTFIGPSHLFALSPVVEKRLKRIYIAVNLYPLRLRIGWPQNVRVLAPQLP